MSIKHNKLRNTGLLFELLVKQIAADTLSSKDSPAVSLIKKYFSNNTALGKELKLYEFIVKNKNVSQSKAEAIVSTITEISRKLNHKTLKEQKYALIADIKKHYNLDEFFAIQVRDYKPLAALYCLIEAQNSNNLVDPQIIVDNKTTILEHLTSSAQKQNNVRDTLIEEYSKYDKDLRLLTFKILLEKFNNRYRDLLPEQKSILREFITSVSSTTRLRSVINTELAKVLENVSKLSPKVKDDVIRIKLQEIVKGIQPISNREKITDNHLIALMQYYDLLNELKTL